MVPPDGSESEVFPPDDDPSLDGGPDPWDGEDIPGDGFEEDGFDDPTSVVDEDWSDPSGDEVEWAGPADEPFDSRDSADRDTDGRESDGTDETVDPGADIVTSLLMKSLPVVRSAERRAPLGEMTLPAASPAFAVPDAAARNRRGPVAASALLISAGYAAHALIAWRRRTTRYWIV